MKKILDAMPLLAAIALSFVAIRLLLTILGIMRP